jgi:hypothetical protein
MSGRLLTLTIESRGYHARMQGVDLALIVHKLNHESIAYTNHITACVNGRWVGVDNIWEREKPEARKLLENAAESHLSSARFVSWRFVIDLL